LTLSVFESESDQKYENKYDIDDIRFYPILHPCSAVSNNTLRPGKDCILEILLTISQIILNLTNNFLNKKVVNAYYAKQISLDLSWNMTILCLFIRL